MKNQEKSLQNRTTGQITETGKIIEKNRRKAFWGLQIKYTLAPLLWLYGLVLAVMTGMFLYNWFANVKTKTGIVSFADQMSALPITLMFFILLIGSQVIVAVGFLRQERNKLGMKRLFLPDETKNLIRFGYSFLTTFTGYLMNFLVLCVLLVLDNLLLPSHAFGGVEMHQVFYRFTHLYRLYPFLNSWALLIAMVIILAFSVMAPQVVKIRKKLDLFYGIDIPFFLLAIAYLSIGTSKAGIIGSIVYMAIRGFCYCWNYFFAYVRRHKDDRAEFVS